MGKLQYIQEDIFNTKRKVIAHGCNTQGAFGAGIAKQIARLYPIAKAAYLNKYQHDGWELGEIQVVPVTIDKIIVNMATQDNFGRNGIHVDYKACELAFKKLLRYCEAHWLHIAIPKIGSGLGGGEWSRIEEILLKVLKKHEVEIDVHYL